MKEYTIIIHPAAEGGYWAEVPALGGIGSQGETLEEAIAMTKDALEGVFESLRAHGERVPDEDSIIVNVEVAA